jgi:L-ascorbate metabolism protein UlaG (beta-lactamase superfamily)
MDLRYYGANCVDVTFKGRRIVIDDNLADLGAKTVTKADDVALFTGLHASARETGLTFDGPGEYEVADISIRGFTARSHIDEPSQKSTTMFKLIMSDESMLFTGHIYPELSEAQLEAIGIVDILIIPVGGNGYTLDPVGALKIIKLIEPKLIIPTHYDDQGLNYPVPQQTLENALKEMSIEAKDTVTKLRIKPGELTDVMQLVVVEKAT